MKGDADDRDTLDDECDDVVERTGDCMCGVAPDLSMFGVWYVCPVHGRRGKVET